VYAKNQQSVQSPSKLDFGSSMHAYPIVRPSLPARLVSEADQARVSWMLRKARVRTGFSKPDRRIVPDLTLPKESESRHSMADSISSISTTPSQPCSNHMGPPRLPMTKTALLSSVKYCLLVDFSPQQSYWQVTLPETSQIPVFSVACKIPYKT